MSSAADTSGAGWAEHRYPEGNQLTLRLVGAITPQGYTGEPAGWVVVSIYEQSGHTTVAQPYLVRGHVVTFTVGDPEWSRQYGHVQGRLAHHGTTTDSLEQAWDLARRMAASLQESHAILAAAAGERGDA